jgi:hypothetical protein
MKRVRLELPVDLIVKETGFAYDQSPIRITKS